ncbi:MAG: hypothetical protein WD069_13675 [Planctomycetales bacterium]
MFHAYHVIFGAYGFWLPNDPRGSWSDFVGSWELLQFGRATKVTTRRSLAHSKRLREEGLHPLAGHIKPDGTIPTPWEKERTRRPLGGG